jgi:HEPN domain-containing protein
VPGPDPTHWLHRLTPAEWLAAAETELGHAAEALGRRAYRPGVTHARRAAGMAWNAVLAVETDEARSADLLARYGRSYMEHVVALTSADDVPDAVRDAAQLLRDTPPAPPELVTLGKPDLRALEAARTITAHARTKLAP